MTLIFELGLHRAKDTSIKYYLCRPHMQTKCCIKCFLQHLFYFILHVRTPLVRKSLSTYTADTHTQPVARRGPLKWLVRILPV